MYSDSEQAALYRLLAHCFSFPGPDFVAILRQRVGELRVNSWQSDQSEWPRLTLVSFVQELARLDREALAALREEYARLFGSETTPGLCPPHEHAYAVGAEKEAVRQRVAKTYAAWGRGVPAGTEDRVDVELEFMAFLLAIPASELRAVAACLQREQFLQEHVLGWMPRLAEELAALTRPGFYRQVAHLLASALATETAIHSRGASLRPERAVTRSIRTGAEPNLTGDHQSHDARSRFVMNSNQRALSRREFLKLSGAAAASTAAWGAGLRFFTPAAQAAMLQGPDGLLYGVCGVCSMGCAFHSHLRDGRITYLTGSPADQTAEGKLCVKGYSALRLLYDPDRLKAPLRRTNPDKGIGVDPGWVVISWDEALDLVAGKFKEIRDVHGPQALAVIARGQIWQKHFAYSLGTPNLVSHNDTCYTSHEVAWRAMVTGTGKTWTVDYEHSRYILAFGWDGMGKSKNHWGRAVNNALDKGARLVVFDPRLSITASRAHEWIPIKPGTDLAALLAMIHVIIDEGLYDHEFVDRFTSGFDELKAHVRPYTPDWAAPICEVPAATLARIAREFAATRPAVVASHKRDAGGPNYVNSWHTAQCFVIMDALAGSLDRPGGHILDRQPKLPGLRDVWEFPPYAETIKGPRIDGMERVPILYKTGKGAFNTIAEGILAQNPYPLKGAFVWKHNVLSFPNPPRMVEALKTLDFLAVSDVLPSEMVQLADVVLPDNTFFESSAMSARQYHAMYPQVALREALPALYDTKGFGGVALEILKRMGLAEYVPQGMGGKGLMEAQLATLGATVDEMKANGGVWGEPQPLQPRTEFGTASKKIELYATLLEEHGYPALPTWKPIRSLPDARYPFHLIIWRRPWERMTQTQNDPIMAQFYDENCATLNTQTARRLGIGEGDRVWVESPVGRIQLKASLTQGIRPDCVAVDHGFGHWSPMLSVAYGKGANDGDLIPNHSIEQQLAEGDPGMSAMMQDVAVNVYRV